MATDATWEHYPANWVGGDATLFNAVDLKTRLEDPEGIFFAEAGDEINVRITDVANGETTVATSKVYTDAVKLMVAIDEVPDITKIRIISIYSERTIEPLQVTSEVMRKILHKYEVHPDFLRVLFSFGEEPHLAEASSGSFAIHSSDSTNEQETYITYKVNYVEENLRKGKDPWSFRHTGIYHHHTEKFDLFILLHPNDNSVLEERLFSKLPFQPTSPHDVPLNSTFCNDAYQLHLLVMSSFSDKWRWYFRHLGDDFAHENNMAMIVSPEKADAQESFQRVQILRNMNDFALFAKACCNSNLDIVELLKCSQIASLTDASSLNAQKTILRGHVESSGVLEGRIRNTIDLVGYTLTLHNQLETANVDRELRDMTKTLRDLTQNTVDDSVTVKIITYVSAFYLPGSFIASIYGMNFFVVDTASMRISIARDFWIFVATWLPLTLITGVIFMLTVFFDLRSKNKPFRWLWQSKPTPSTGQGP